MIGWLKGVLIEKSSNSVIIDVTGVGYAVFCTKRLMEGVSLGDGIEVFVSIHVRENEISLFGFSSNEEKHAFLHLQSTPRVGAKMAMSILNTLTVDSINEAVIKKDMKTFSRAEGIGSKVAARIIQELSGEFTDVGNFGESDLTSALERLGYTKQEIGKVLSKINLDQSLKQKIKDALKELKS